MPRVRLSSPNIVSEVIDGEAIILDVEAGIYYATDGVGAAAWSAAVDGWSTEQIAESAAAFYSGQPDSGTAVAGLLQRFMDAGLLASDDTDAPALADPIAWPDTYAAPTFEQHSDLAELMRLDPIHDTDESGWPAAAPNTP